MDTKVKLQRAKQEDQFGKPALSKANCADCGRNLPYCGVEVYAGGVVLCYECHERREENEKPKRSD